MDSQLYIVNTPIEAIDLAFNIIWALNPKYPPECKYAWLLIQRTMYNIGTEHDISIPVKVTKVFVDLNVSRI